MATFRIPTAGKPPDTRWRTSPIRLAKRQPPEQLFWWHPIQPISGARPWCNSPAATLQRSTPSRSRLPAHGDRVRIRAVLPYFFLMGVLPVHAQPCWNAGPVAPNRTYKLLTEDEDWSFLRD